MTQEIAIRQVPQEHELMVFQTMAAQAVDSKMYRGIGDKAGIMMIMLSARELGISPMAALNGGLNIINGKVEISARMMSALIRKAGHMISVKESTATECILVGTRGDTLEVQSASFSIQEAQLAGLVKAGGGWTKWPKDMLFARALSRLARQLFSDVIGIGYVEGEISGADTRAGAVYSETSQVTCYEDPEATSKPRYCVEEFTELFPEEDRELSAKYLAACAAHFKWNTSETIEELFKDMDKTKDRFNAWKMKQQK
jgi:hypothetical protein